MYIIYKDVKMYICIVYDMECSVRVLILFLIYIMNPQLDTIFSFSLEQEQLGLLYGTQSYIKEPGYF